METVVISLGGSVVVPGHIDTTFLKGFKKLVMRHKDKRFLIIVGGGRTCRVYQDAAASITKLRPIDVDWVGIHATRLNAQLLRNIFNEIAHPYVIKNPAKKITAKERVIIGAGWKPGRSTDYIAVMLAKNLGAKRVINITNTSYVYDRDPRKYKNARPLKSVSWREFRKILGTSRWSPGLNAPFDPVAAKAAEKNGFSIAIVGKNLKNLDSALSRKKFRGTHIY